MKCPILDRLSQIKAKGGYDEVSIILSTNDDAILELAFAGEARTVRSDDRSIRVADWLDGIIKGLDELP